MFSISWKNHQRKSSQCNPYELLGISVAVYLKWAWLMMEYVTFKQLDCANRIEGVLAYSSCSTRNNHINAPLIHSIYVFLTIFTMTNTNLEDSDLYCDIKTLNLGSRWRHGLNLEISQVRSTLLQYVLEAIQWWKCRPQSSVKKKTFVPFDL